MGQNQQDSERLSAHIRQYMSDRGQRACDANHKEVIETQKKHLAVIEWLSTSGGGAIKDHENACSTRAESKVSGSWILKHEKVRNWRETDPPTSSILWLHGKPGAGIANVCKSSKSKPLTCYQVKQSWPRSLSRVA